jgi:DNA-binding GntR family transcriptional regulator
MAKFEKKTKKKKTISLRQQLYNTIKAEIISCKLEPGQPLSEGEFADRFHVSKTPVREAITALEQDNLVIYIPNRGFTVNAITLKDIHEIYEARLFLECKLFELAVKNITEVEIQTLEKYNQVSYDMTKPASIDQYLQSNLDFHLGIAQAAHNSRLYQLYARLMDETQRLIYLDFKTNNVLQTWQMSHKRLTDALRERDAEKGVNAIKEFTAVGKMRILNI